MEYKKTDFSMQLCYLRVFNDYRYCEIKVTNSGGGSSTIVQV